MMIDDVIKLHEAIHIYRTSQHVIKLHEAVHMHLSIKYDTNGIAMKQSKVLSLILTDSVRTRPALMTMMRSQAMMVWSDGSLGRLLV